MLCNFGRITEILRSPCRFTSGPKLLCTRFRHKVVSDKIALFLRWILFLQKDFSILLRRDTVFATLLHPLPPKVETVGFKNHFTSTLTAKFRTFAEFWYQLLKEKKRLLDKLTHAHRVPNENMSTIVRQVLNNFRVVLHICYGKVE